MKRASFALMLALAADVAAGAAPVPPAGLAVVNANIRTAAASRPTARALAVREGRIVAIGDDAEVRPFIGPRTRVVDLGGGTLLPGLIDSHGHMLGFGTRLRDVDVVGTASYDAVIARVVERAKTVPAGEWILGRGWDQNDWPETAMPNHAALSRAVPNHPVRLTRIDGHAALVNRKALELAGITRDTKDPEGGAILRDAAGEPTGVLVDKAARLVNSIVPPIRQEERERRLLEAMRECARLGLTMVHDAGIDEAEWTAYRALLGRGTFPIRIAAMARADSALAESLLSRGATNGDLLSLRAIK
ncbi:MAG: amidohydrolase, partial [Candidatus Eiseniibacteriota bacterium]